MAINNTYLINPYSLTKIFIGCSDIEFREYENEGVAKFKYAGLEVVLIIPRLHEDGHMIHNGVCRIPMIHFISGIMLTPTEYMEMKLARTVSDFNISRSMYGYNIRPTMFQSMLDTCINYEPLGYGNSLYKSVMKDRVLIHPEQEFDPIKDYEFRVGVQSIREIDTLATTMGDKIGLINFLVDNNEDPANNKVLSKLSRKIPFIEHTNLGRVPIITSNMLHAVELLYNELPMITTADTGHIPEPPGINTRVAFFSTAETFEDTIVVSKSLANRFCCLKRKPFLWHNARPLVKSGDIVEHGQALCEDSEGEHHIWLNNHKSFAFIDDVKICNRPYMNIIHKILSIELSIVYDLCDGDKLSNRSGQKGTVKIMPDKWMPVDNFNRRIDIIINPYSIYKGPDKGRRNYGQLIEAVLSHRIKKGERMFVRQFAGEYNIKEIAKMECPKVFHKGKTIDCINGIVFMTRQDNHSADNITATGSTRTMTADLREVSGVRLGLADIMILGTLYNAHDILIYMSKYVTGLEGLSEYAKTLPVGYKEAARQRNVTAEA